MGADSGVKAELHHYFRQGREALLWKLDGVSEYDARRPLTPTGTNLLGLVKHTAIVVAGYFGTVFDRPFPQPLPWAEETAEPNDDMWVLPGETREQVVTLFPRRERACRRDHLRPRPRLARLRPVVVRARHAEPDPRPRGRRGAPARRTRRPRPRGDRRCRRAAGGQLQPHRGRRGVVGGVPGKGSGGGGAVPVGPAPAGRSPPPERRAHPAGRSPTRSTACAARGLVWHRDRQQACPPSATGPPCPEVDPSSDARVPTPGEPRRGTVGGTGRPHAHSSAPPVVDRVCHVHRGCAAAPERVCRDPSGCSRSGGRGSPGSGRRQEPRPTISPAHGSPIGRLARTPIAGLR
jgi:hypothetical protein